VAPEAELLEQRPDLFLKPSGVGVRRGRVGPTRQPRAHGDDRQ
jgi:hypothetical protein